MIGGELFRRGAALRQSRFFHPDGVLATGVLERDAPTGAGLPVPSATVVARISKATGTPGALPDAVGLALRIPASAPDQGCWDILLASAGSGIVGRALGIRPALRWSGLTMTSLQPLSYREQTWWLRARLNTPIDGLGLSLRSIRRQLDGGEIRFELEQARGTAGFHPLAHLVLTGLEGTGDAGHDVSFDPTVNTAPGVELRPRWLTRLRADAYRASREGRAATAPTPPPPAVAGPRDR